MAHKNKMSAIYLAGLIQGVVLVAFPAAGTLLTSSKAFNFSSTQYGALFISQSILSIVASALSSKLSSKLGFKKTFYVGLFANFIAMSLFALSALFIHETWFVYPLLIFATSFIGIGFGVTVPTINTLAAIFNPKAIDTVILILNALLGVGTVLAPLFISIFVGLGVWWGLPLLLIFLLLFLMLFSLPLTFPKVSSCESTSSSKLPKRAFIFIAFACFYGIVETLNGNWAAIYMREIQKAPAQMQSLALTLFWAMVTFGRVFFASFQRFLSSRLVYQGLPLLLMIAFISIGMLKPNHLFFSLFAIGLAGLGCSALLPLTISFGSSQLPAISQSVAAIVVAFYLLGYGIAAFGPGLALDETSFTLSNIYLFASIFAILLAIFAYFINLSKEDSK